MAMKTMLRDIHLSFQFFNLPLYGLFFLFTDIAVAQTAFKAQQHHFFSVFGTGILVFHESNFF